jgi:predicted TIM-barrel fold metal-dependent hydrolase
MPGLKLTLNNLTHVPADQGADSQAARDLLSLSDFPHTYVNFSVNFIQRTLDSEPAKELLQAMLERFGPRRLIWSSFGRNLKDTKSILLKGLAFLTEEDRADVLGEGARDLYPTLRKHRPS